MHMRGKKGRGKLLKLSARRKHVRTANCGQRAIQKSRIILQVNQNLLYRESDWWDVGLVVQKARKQGTVC